MLRILSEPKNSIVKQYVKLFDMDKIELTFDIDVFEYIVDKAIEYKLGARGLRSIVEAIMIDAMFHLPSEDDKKKLNVTKKYAEEHLEKSNLLNLQVA